MSCLQFPWQQVVSLKEQEEEEEEFLESFTILKAEMMSRYRLCVECSLGHTRFLTADDIVVFRAFVTCVA